MTDGPSMTDRPAPGAQLFFLEDGAVLFSEPRQELHAFNTMAAAIWCHLEDGKDRPAIAQELISGLGVAAADAARFVDQAMEAWKLQGLLTGRRGPTHRPPEYLRQPPDDAPDYRAPVFVTERHYRLLSVAFRLRCTTAQDDALLAPVFSHLASRDAPVTNFDVVRHGDTIAIYRDGKPAGLCHTTEELVPIVHDLVWLDIADLHGFFLELHTGVIGGGGLGADGCILLPARSGSGKTTLTAALVHAGWDYLSDEVALLDAATMRVAPVPTAFCLKRSGLDAVAEFWPAAKDLAFHLRQDGKRVAYLPPPAERVAPPDARMAVRGIVFPRYRKDRDLAWHTLSQTDALRRLVEECVAISGRLDAARVGALVNWIADIPCHELAYGSTASGVSAIRKAFGDPTGAPMAMQRTRQAHND